MLIKDENHGKLFLRINLISVLGALLTPIMELPVIVRAVLLMPDDGI